MVGERGFGTSPSPGFAARRSHHAAADSRSSGSGCNRRLVQQGTTQLVAIQTSLMQQTGEAFASNDIKQLTCSLVDALSLEPGTALGIKTNLFVLQALQKQMDIVEEVLAAYCHGNREYKLLTSVAGIGPIYAGPGGHWRFDL